MRPNASHRLPWPPIVGRQAASGLRWLERAAGSTAALKFLGGKVRATAFGGQYLIGIADSAAGRHVICRLPVLLRARRTIALCDVNAYYAAGRSWPLGMRLEEGNLVDVWPPPTPTPTSPLTRKPVMSHHSNDEEYDLLLYSFFPQSVMWMSPEVDVEPRIRLIDWTIKEDIAGNRYFVGTREDDRLGRVSTPIVEFDHEQHCGRTLSGRIYELTGAPGRSSNGDYVWSIFKAAHGIEEPVK